jgi:peptidoglycan/xylan/chitin deacetylase (PgdA/CDA1 family)
MPADTSNVLVLCYHAVSRSWPAILSVTPAQLERQLELLISRGYRGATFSEAVSGPSAKRTVAVTFDDGYSSVRELAFPILSRLGLPGTVFVTTSFVGVDRPMAWPGIDQWLGGPHQSELAGMTWEDLSFLAGAGWEVGSHTRTHPRLTTLGDEALADELRGAREDCERRLDLACRSLAYPYGDADVRVINAAREAGYAVGAGMRIPYRPDTRRWPRIGVYHGDTMARFRLKASPTLRRFRKSPLWTTLDSARRRLTKNRPGGHPS